MITPETIRALVKAELKLAECPMNASLLELGCTNTQMENIQRRILKEFHHTVRVIHFIDTVYDITDRFNNSHTTR